MFNTRAMTWSKVEEVLPSIMLSCFCFCAVDYGLDRMNREVSMWMKMANNRWGQPSQMPFIAVRGFDSIVWSRMYSKENFEKPEEKIQVYI